METNHKDLWVANRLTTIEPEWSPNPARGRELLDARLARRRHSWTWKMPAVATAALCLALLALPGTRAFAQELWYRFVLDRVDIVRLDLSALPLHTRVTTNGLEQSVQSMDEAERKAGFRPYLPSPGVLHASPGITVTGPISVEQTIHVRDIESALGKVDASDVQVPAEWEGIHFRTEIGPVVSANYPDDVHIREALPIQFSVPSGFALEHFAEVTFRSLGVFSWEARDMAQKFAAHPAWLLDVPPDAVVNVQEVALRAGTALLLEHFDQKGGVERETVTWGARNRMYSVSSRSRELSMEIANALP